MNAGERGIKAVLVAGFLYDTKYDSCTARAHLLQVHRSAWCW